MPTKQDLKTSQGYFQNFWQAPPSFLYGVETDILDILV